MVRSAFSRACYPVTIAGSEKVDLTPPMPEISKRAASLGTENAFVVLAEVNALARQGRDIISFCIGQPDFPAPENVQQAAIRAIKGGKHGYTPSAGIDELRAAAALAQLVDRSGAHTSELQSLRHTAGLRLLEKIIC